MTRMGHFAIAVFFLPGVFVSAPAGAQEFQPFTDVGDVCPDCPGPHTEVLTLVGGETVKANLVAENDDFFVAERYGEVRTIPHAVIATVKWTDESRRSELKSQDQILLPNGHVLTGKIIKESDEPAFFQLESSLGDFTHVAFEGQIDRVYRQGKRSEARTGTAE